MTGRLAWFKQATGVMNETTEMKQNLSLSLLLLL